MTHFTRTTALIIAVVIVVVVVVVVVFASVAGVYCGHVAIIIIYWKDKVKTARGCCCRCCCFWEIFIVLAVTIRYLTTTMTFYIYELFKHA
jgi:hypothetical protein